VTTTLVSPTAGRVGPGTLVVATNDLVGPYVPGAMFYCWIELPSSGVATCGFAIPMNHTVAGRFGTLQPNIPTTYGGGNGVLDGAAVDIRTYYQNPTGGRIDELVSTGFTWDAVSNLWLAIELSLLSMTGSTGAIGSQLAAILASVKHTYSSP